MTSVFVSYRRDDAGGHAGRLADRLEARFGRERVFVDVEDIQPGQNFAQTIEQTLSRCDHLLAVIGPRWLEALRERAASREDFVRHEIALGLARGIRVIPVLVGGASMPTAELLPPELAGLARCQAVEVRDNRFDEDAADLLNFLSGGNASDVTPLEAPRSRHILRWLGAIVLVTAGIWFAWSMLHQAPVDGEWIVDLKKAGQSPFRVPFSLMQVGHAITGEVHYPTGIAPILEGRRDGNHLSFHTKHVPDFSSETARIDVEAEFRGGEIQMTFTGAGGVASGLARRGPGDAARTTP